MLTVLMATYNGALTLPAVLTAYCGLQAPPGGWSLLIIDNGSDDATRAVIERYTLRLPVHYLHEPRRGKNVALNTGLTRVLREQHAELLVFTDDDASPQPDWLLKLAECAASHPEYALFGGAIIADWAVAPPDWVLRLVPLGLTYGLTGAADGPVFPGLVWGANMAVRRVVFEAGHRFDEALGPNCQNYAMGGETEFNRRVGAAGFQAWFCTAAVVRHFIRPHQLRRGNILKRAYRFGRGSFRQEADNAFRRLFKVPRWMLSKFVLELGAALRAWVRRDTEQAFLARWELCYLAGYFREAWFGRARRAARVLITSYSGELGGMEMRMAQEAHILAGAGYQSLLATRRFVGVDGWDERTRAPRVEVSRFDPPPIFEQWAWRRVNKARALVLTARQLRNYRADLVHVALCWTTYGMSALWLAHRCGLPTVVSVHNAFPRAHIDPWYVPLLAEAFSSVRGIYAVSESAMQHFLAQFQPYLAAHIRLQVIPNSVDTARFGPSPARRDAARRAMGIPEHALVLGAVGRLSAQKRPQALISLFCTLRRQFDGMYLVLVGSGPLEQELRRQVAAADVAQYVVFTGQRTDIETLLPAFDLHLLLSRNEGFGIATIEAMACGVPVVGTDVPGTADILRHSRGGILVPPDDAPATAALVSELLRDPRRRAEMARHACAEARANYAADQVERQVRAFYAGLLP